MVLRQFASSLTILLMTSAASADGLYSPTDAEMQLIEDTAILNMPGHEAAKIAGLIVGNEVIAVTGEKISWACGTLKDPGSSGESMTDSMFAGYLVRSTGEFIFAGSSDTSGVDYTTFLIGCSQKVLGPAE